MKKVKTIDILAEGTLLPPSPDKCQQCGIKHPPEQAHDGDSLYYQYWFKKHYGRWPTWKDAIEHCPPHIKKIWEEGLRKHGKEV